MQAIANVLANAIERRVAEQLTQHEALHDPLTGLPNRNLFLDRLQHALSAADRRGPQSRCSSWTSTSSSWSTTCLGHAAGRAAAPGGPSDRGGSAPGRHRRPFRRRRVRHPGRGHRGRASERRGSRARRRGAHPVIRPAWTSTSSVPAWKSIGAGTSRRGPHPRRRLRPLPAKERGPGRLRDLRRGHALARDRAHAAVRTTAARGPAGGRSTTTPSIRLRDGAIVAIEALLRWNHPERGLIGPLAFIPVAEDAA